ncbi:MAG: hypothetical protein QNM02_15165 [Acidimicrobiia bacterium]|nr:hypothetical protein [Acidimicrobiia bacterium]
MEDTASPPIGASAWTLDMWTFLTDHIRLEGEMLREYLDEAEGSESKALSYLLNVLVEDERRHHRYFSELASALKSDAELDPTEPVIPRLDLDRIDRADLLTSTRRLIEHEREDLTALKRLRKELHDVEDTTLWAVLVDVMLHDTEKHISILRFVEQHARPRRSPLHP